MNGIKWRAQLMACMGIVLGGLILAGCGQIPAEAVTQDSSLAGAAGLAADNAKKPTPNPPEANVPLGCMAADGTIRIVSQEDLCKNKETLVSWQLAAGVGPQGERGLRGEPGPQGPGGAVAPVVVSFEDVTLTPGLGMVAKVESSTEVPPGSYVVNGALVFTLAGRYANGMMSVPDASCTVDDSRGTLIQEFDLKMPVISQGFNPTVNPQIPVMTIGIPVSNAGGYVGSVRITCFFGVRLPIIVSGNVVLIPATGAAPSETDPVAQPEPPN